MPYTPRQRPIGRPPTRPITPILGWAARRTASLLCAERRSRTCLQPREPAPSKRTRWPQFTACRTRHNPDAPAVVTHAGVTLRRTAEFGILWTCAVCCGWTRDPVRFGYSRRCDICKLARPPRSFVFQHADVEQYREHAAYAHAQAAEVRAFRYDSVVRGRLDRHKRLNGLRIGELFLSLAEARDNALEPPDVEPDDGTWLLQQFCHDERYIGLTDHDTDPVSWPVHADTLLATSAVSTTSPAYALPAPQELTLADFGHSGDDDAPDSRWKAYWRQTEQQVRLCRASPAGPDGDVGSDGHLPRAGSAIEAGRGRDPLRGPSDTRPRVD